MKTLEALKALAKEAEEACLNIGVEALISYAEAVGYKADEPEECVRWELAKAFYKEFKKEVEV